MKIQLTIFFASLIFSAFGQTTGLEEIQNLYDQGKCKETIDLASVEIKKLKTSDSVYKKIVRLRVDCFMKLSDFQSAIDDWKSLMTLDSNDISNYVGISYAYWAIGDESNSLINIHKAYAINPKDAGTLSNMSYYYGQAGKYAESIRYSTIGLEQNNLQNTLKGSLLNNRAYAYINLGQYDKALEDIAQSISFNPQNSYSYCYRALANIGLNKMDSVCADLEKAKSLGGVILTKDLIAKHCSK